MERPQAAQTPQTLGGGQMLAAISTRIVREHYGRGADVGKDLRAGRHQRRVMRDCDFTAPEQTIMDSGQPERVIELFHARASAVRP